MSPEDDDLPPEIRARLQSLRRELAPGDLLEERVVRELRARGLLRSRRPWSRPASWTARLAAGLLLFVSGWMIGNRPPRQEAVSAAEQVEQAGAELVQALTTVARQTPSEEDDARLEQVIVLLDEAGGKSSRAPSKPNQVFWF